MYKTSLLMPLLPTIRNIIFDLGGVIVNINYMLTQQAFEELGVANFGAIYSQAAQTGLFDEYEKGLISDSEFRARLRAFAPNLVLTDKAIDGAWNAMLLDIPAERLSVLNGIKSKVRTFLLSNTNAIHISSFNKSLERSIGKPNLNDYFEQAYYSHNIHFRKPDAEAFRFVLETNGLNPSETLFVDDTIRHVEGAQKLGIHAIHVGSDLLVDELYSKLANFYSKQQ